MVDKINPAHYQNRGDNLQVIDVIEQFNFSNFGTFIVEIYQLNLRVIDKEAIGLKNWWMSYECYHNPYKFKCPNN